MLDRLAKRVNTKDEAGFTLIELLIVIVILGILAAIVVFAIGKTRGDAVNSSCKTSVKSVQLSEEAIKTKGGAYAASDAELTAAGNKGGLLKTMPVATGDYTISWTSGSTTAYSFTIAPVGSSGIPTTVISDTTNEAAINTACTPV